MKTVLLISKVERTHEAGFRVTEKIEELYYKHTSKDGQIKRISEPFNLTLRNKNIIQIYSSIYNNCLSLVAYSNEKEVLYLSGDIERLPYKLVSTLEDGLRYQFELIDEN